MRVRGLSDKENEPQENRMAWEQAFARGESFYKQIHPEMALIANQFQARKFRRILDLGCGTGRHTIFLAELGFDVYGLDIAPTGLIKTIEKLAEKGLTAHLTLSDMLILPYDDEFFDGLISVQVIHHNRIKAIRDTVAEIWRVIKPNGLVWITVPVPQGHPSKRGREIEPQTFIPLEGCEKGLPHHLFTEEELVDTFHQFSVVHLHTSHGYHYSLLAEKIVDKEK